MLYNICLEKVSVFKFCHLFSTNGVKFSFYDVVKLNLSNGREKLDLWSYKMHYIPDAHSISVHLMLGFDFFKENIFNENIFNGLKNFGDKLKFVHCNANNEKILRK